MKELVPLVTAIGGAIITAENRSSSHLYTDDASIDKTPYSSPAPIVIIWTAPCFFSSIRDTDFRFCQSLMDKQKWRLFPTPDFYQSVALTEAVKHPLTTIMFVLNISDIIRIIKMMPLRMWQERLEWLTKMQFSLRGHIN